MKPFEDKLKNLSSSAFPTKGPWAFLKDWESPLTEKKLEKLSDRGKRDAEVGCRLSLYPALRGVIVFKA